MIAILPMAGRGSRFTKQGYETPKPLIEVAGKPMVAWALETLKGLKINRLVVVALRKHEEYFEISRTITDYCPETVHLSFVWLEGVTEGQLCTVMSAEEFLDTEEPLLIIPCDTFVIGNLDRDISMLPKNSAGLISVAAMPGNRWSFAKTDETGKVVEVAEKVRISNLASTGVYFFSKANLFHNYAKFILEKKEKTKGEYYIIPVYQKMIEDGFWVGISRANEVLDMGTPESKESTSQKLWKK